MDSAVGTAAPATVSGPTRRTLRTNLRHVAARLGAGPSPARLARERAKKPYTGAQIAACHDP